jgi:PAS domain S-box-containing protein
MRVDHPNLRDGQLAHILDVTSDAIATLDHDWNFRYLNRRARQLLIAREDLTGKNLWTELFPHGAGELETRLRRTMEEGLPADFDDYYSQTLERWLSIQARRSDDGIVVFFRDITERRQREQALLDQQELLSVIQQTALAATWDLDLRTRRISFGPGSYPLLGRPFEEFSTPESLERIVARSDLKRVRRAIRDALASPAMVVLEFQIETADGRCRWLECRGRSIHQDGEPTHIRGLVLDVTERKKNEEKLVESEARYRALTDLNPQAIWMGSAGGAITYANQRLLDFIGQTPETMGEAAWLNAVAEEDSERVREAWARSIRTGVDFEIEARVVRASDEEHRWWRIRALPIRDEAGEILHWLGVGMDIHDARAAAEALNQKQRETERQRAELETVYQTAPVGLAQFDPVEFRCLRLNERQAEIFGIPSEQLIGQRVDEMAPITGVQEMLQVAAEGHTVRNQIIEGVLPTRPGEHRVWDVSYSPVYADDGGVQAITAAWLEITHLKKAEAALVQSEKLAAVGRLASSISHEINNPLEAITNLLYLISQSEKLPEDLRIYIHMAQSELSRVSQIATQTLRFHRQAAKPTWVSPAELLDAVLNLYHGRLTNSGVRVEASYSTDMKVLCFENDIRQVLNNLIANAIDAMRQGGRLVVRAHEATQHSSGKRGVRLTVADTGHGMPEAVRRRLFQPFYTTKGLNGTGLGLWISEGIVKRHRGRMEVRSSQDPVHHGTVFTLFLPAEEGIEQEKAA